MKKVPETKKLLFGVLAIGGIAVGFSLGLNRGQEKAYVEAKARYAPVMASAESQYRMLTQQEQKRKEIPSSSQGWMPLQFRFSMLKEILAEAPASELPRAMLARILALPKEEIEATLIKMQKLPRDEYDFIANFAEYALLMRFAELDPEAALKFANKTDMSRRESTRAAVLAVLAESNASRAAMVALDAETLTKRSAFTRAESTRAVSSAWAKQDPEAAVDWGQSLPDAGLQAGAIGDAVYHTPYDQWGNLVGRIHDPYVHDLVAGDMAYRWALSEPQAAIDWAYSVPPLSSQYETYRDPVVHAMRGWWRQYPSRAAAYLENLSSQTRRNRDIYREALPELFQEWLISDPAGALAYANSLPDCPFRKDIITSIHKALVIVIDLEKLDLGADPKYAGQKYAAFILGTSEGLGAHPVLCSLFSTMMSESMGVAGKDMSGLTSEIIAQAKDFMAVSGESGVLTQEVIQSLEAQANAAESQAQDAAATEKAAAAEDLESRLVEPRGDRN